MTRSTKITRHARGQECQLRLPGICNCTSDTVVFAHLNGSAFGKGMGLKAHDFAGCFAGFECHTYLDVGHGTKPRISDAELAQCLLRAVVGTWAILIRDGIIFTPEDAPKERKVKPRKPREERKAIAQRQDAWPPKGSRKLQSRNTLKETRNAG